MNQRTLRAAPWLYGRAIRFPSLQRVGPGIQPKAALLFLRSMTTRAGLLKDGLYITDEIDRLLAGRGQPCDVDGGLRRLRPGFRNQHRMAQNQSTRAHPYSRKLPELRKKRGPMPGAPCAVIEEVFAQSLIPLRVEVRVMT